MLAKCIGALTRTPRGHVTRSQAVMWRSALVLCLLVAVCGGLTPHLDDRIVGGEPVDISQFPWQVSLEEYQDGWHKHFCGGSIIGSTWVLTTAHGTKRTFTLTVYVRAGSSFCEKGGNVYRVVIIIEHEDYEDVTTDYDFALLELSEPIFFGSNLQAVLLRSSVIDSGTKVNVTGWGYTLEEGLQPEQLHAVATSIIERDTRNTQE